MGGTHLIRESRQVGRTNGWTLFGESSVSLDTAEPADNVGAGAQCNTGRRTSFFAASLVPPPPTQQFSVFLEPPSEQFPGSELFPSALYLLEQISSQQSFH